jgi:hypothetical protein
MGNLYEMKDQPVNLRYVDLNVRYESAGESRISS